MKAEELRAFVHGPSRRVHLIGVSGSGMSGIAALLIALGHRVSGSDRTDTLEVRRLTRKGLHFCMPHTPECVHGAELIIYSSAVRPGNPAFDEAQKLGLPMVRRADALAAIIADRKGVIVSGMHGKTTTSSMAAYALRAAGIKTSHYVGAEIPILGSNARWDSDGEYFVAEGDESDGSLVNYHPFASIVLNIEPEHLDFYRNLDEIDAVFAQLVAQTSGPVIYCSDDPGATRVVTAASSSVERISYGLAEGADYRISALRMENGRPVFRVEERGVTLGEVSLGIPGRHNATNALAVIALGLRLGAKFEDLREALARFEGARRRFETLYCDPDFRVVDDYGHHPTEIIATLVTARESGAKRVLVMFQPHRFTRTAALRAKFGDALADADALAVTSIYAASETPIEGVHGGLVADAAREAGCSLVMYEPELKKLPAALGPLLEPGDFVLSLGAGNIHEAGKSLARLLALRREVASVMGRGVIKVLEPLSKHTTMRVGGPADLWVEPETESGFADLVRFCSDRGIPLMVVGRGSNLIVRDGGLRGVVAHLARGEFLRYEVNGTEITAGVGLKFKQISAIARRAGIGDFEWMEGIPGNLGGGLRMNAGAMGWQTFDQVVRVHFCDEEGNLFTRSAEEIEAHYRDVPLLRKNYALSATLRGRRATAEEIEKKLRASELKRKNTQPIAASAGCIFKNPPEVPAGQLIEELGLKGLRHGGAVISKVHGNFVINEGNATASDVIALIEIVQRTALEKRGICLEPEAQIVGEETLEL